MGAEEEVAAQDRVRLELEVRYLEDVPTRPHRARARRFERAKPNQLWQTDIHRWGDEECLEAAVVAGRPPRALYFPALIAP